MRLHKSQSVVATDTHQYRVVDCGRQWGKTTLSVLEMIACAYGKNGREIAYFATTYDQARNIAWNILKEYSQAAWAKPPNESRLELTLKTQDKGTSRITLRGYENVETARGQQFDLLVLDECAQMRNFNYAWQAILEPTLAFRKGNALFISTPLGHNHFFDLYVKGQTEGLWKSWKFSSYDNPFLPVERLDQAKREVDEDTFAQEYMAEFKKYSGLVYKEFSREQNVIDPYDIPPSWTRYRLIDFGFINPTAVVFLAINDKGDIIVYDLIYQKGLSTPDLANLIAQRSLGQQITQTIGDSASASDIAELSTYGIPTFGVKKESGDSNVDWTTYRIRKVTEKLKNNSLKVFKTCEALIYEFENYQYKEVREGDIVKEVPMKMNDHALDALSYGIVSLPEFIEKTYSVTEYKPYNPQKWSV